MKQRKPKDDDNGQRKVEQQLRDSFISPLFESEDYEIDLRLTELAGVLLMHSPARQQLAVDILRACFKAWEAARDEYGHTNMLHPSERVIVHSYHELLIQLENLLSPLPFDESIRRELEIYGAGADFQTKTAINKALKSGDRQAIGELWAIVGTYGYVRPEKRRAKGGARR
jgi:hypothetical protein